MQGKRMMGKVEGVVEVWEMKHFWNWKGDGARGEDELEPGHDKESATNHVSRGTKRSEWG